jgi:hypothetical protein
MYYTYSDIPPNSKLREDSDWRGEGEEGRRRFVSVPKAAHISYEALNLVN